MLSHRALALVRARSARPVAVSERFLENPLRQAFLALGGRCCFWHQAGAAQQLSLLPFAMPARPRPSWPLLTGHATPVSLGVPTCVFSRGGKTYPPAARTQRKRPKKLKLKSHSGAKKRFKLRADGTFVHGWCGKRHLNVGTHSRARRRKRRMKTVASRAMNRKLRRLLPYAGTRSPPPAARCTASTAPHDVVWGRRPLARTGI
jgi:ribosomal protein L35